MGEYRQGGNPRFGNMRSILVINPNSTESMTDGLKPLIDALHFKDTAHAYFTAPSGPKSINNEDDAVDSVPHCLPPLRQLLGHHDAFLVACYSQHPLVPLLKEQDAVKAARKPVTGIFEASVATSLQLIHPDERFGIVSTGKVWEDILSDAVVKFLGTAAQDASKRFAGVETTGLNATDLHDAPANEVRKRMKEATKRLVGKGNVGAVCLGCAGMSGMDEMVREACVEELGEVEGGRIRIVDGVQAGVAWLEGAVRSGF
ncbi:hydantoin racemase-like protein [Corynespora cassiicola Philippines]|uniref:Hydantoin racemase-like protein n=1 Tax=Corynespora cassiicola Philippines TaxID=1448308 RepID=A0A2T2NM97_CORCC|nr:hydantoin racemase-like protein [Corynespora cassiicola Philippines]